MKKVKLKYEFLISGLYPFDGEYTKDKYVLKRNVLEDEKFNIHMENDIIYINPLIGFCCYPYQDKNVYLTFETEKEINMDISNYDKKEVNKELEKIEIWKESENLEQALVLELNNNIKFPIKILKVYDEKNRFLTMRMDIAKLNVPSLLCYDESVCFERIERQNYRLSSGFSYEKLIALRKNNNLFDRALSLYYSSFSVCDKSAGFILLITSLETLFNLSTYSKIKSCQACSQPIYRISESISNNIDLILMGENEEIKKYMKKQYRKRSKYLHGEKVSINEKDEQDLQEYVRSSLLMYWLISIDISSYDHKKIVAEFQKEIYKNNFNYKSFLISLKKQSFNDKKEDILRELLKQF